MSSATYQQSGAKSGSQVRAAVAAISALTIAVRRAISLSFATSVFFCLPCGSRRSAVAHSRSSFSRADFAARSVARKASFYAFSLAAASFAAALTNFCLSLAAAASSLAAAASSFCLCLSAAIARASIILYTFAAASASFAARASCRRMSVL